MASVVIGIHGLGNKPSEALLKKWWKEAMEEGLKTHGYKAKMPDFELVYWADILYEKPLSESVTDKEDPLFLEEKYTIAPEYRYEENHDFRAKVVGYLSDKLNSIFLDDDKSLNYTSVADVIVSRYFKDLDSYYRSGPEIETRENDGDLINNRLATILNKHRSDRIFLIGHSMGSIIAYNVINFDAPDIPVHTFVTMGSPLGLPVVVSKIADRKKLGKSVGPLVKSPESVTRNWYNFSDINDNVALNYKLADDFEANSLGVMPVDFLVVNNYEMNGVRNAHKSYGYLRTPEFSKVLNDFITSEKLSIPQRVIRIVKNALSAFSKKGGTGIDGSQP